MVTGNDTIKLELTVDRAAMEQQLGQVFDAGPVAPSVGGGRAGEGAKVAAGPSFGRMLAPLAALTGISLGITSLVRGSQVMSTTVGALNTTLSALVDSFLAPLAPYLVKLIDLAAKLFPAAEAAGEATKAKVDVVNWFLGGGKPGVLPEEVDKPDVVLEGMRRLFLDFPMLFGKAFNENIQVILGQREEATGIGDILEALNRRSAERLGVLPGGFPEGQRRVMEDPEKRERFERLSAVRQVQREERGMPTYNISVYGADTEEAVRKIREELEATKRLGITRTPGGR